ncbi:uncharacterized protein LOC120347073 [Styela clava]
MQQKQTKKVPLTLGRIICETTTFETTKITGMNESKMTTNTKETASDQKMYRKLRFCIPNNDCSRYIIRIYCRNHHRSFDNLLDSEIIEKKEAEKPNGNAEQSTSSTYHHEKCRI